MQEETRHQIALARYKLISPVLAEPSRAQNAYFREQASKPHALPHYGVRKLSVPTLKRWLKLYRKQGFDGLKPMPRSDRGRPRKLSDTAWLLCAASAKPSPIGVSAGFTNPSLQMSSSARPP